MHRILCIKERSVSKGLIVIAASATVFEPELSKLDSETRSRVEASWPGPTSWIVPTDRYPNWVTGDFLTVAVRVPEHDQARRLAREFGGSLVSTSANESGQEPCRTEAEANVRLGHTVDFILSGSIGSNPGPSKIIDAQSGKQIR